MPMLDLLPEELLENLGLQESLLDQNRPQGRRTPRGGRLRLQAQAFLELFDRQEPPLHGQLPQNQFI
jgi:hypothetical protein